MAAETALEPGILSIFGKIADVEAVGDKGTIQTIIVSPAQDPYQHPRKYCVFSKRKLGRKDDEVEVQAEVICRPWRDNKGTWRYPHQLWEVEI